MIKLIIFDWDDVFTKGSMDGYYACYRKALQEIGVTLDPVEEDRRIRARWGAGGRKQLELLLKEHPELIDEAYDMYKKHAHGKTFTECLNIVPGAQDFLLRIAKKYQLAIATGAHPNVLHELVMPKFNIPDVFAQIITIYDLDDMVHAKPHPYIAQKIMATQGVTPTETVLVGDAISDMQMARNAGVEPVAVLTGQMDRAAAEEFGVKHIIEDVTQLETALAALNK